MDSGCISFFSGSGRTRTSLTKYPRKSASGFEKMEGRIDVELIGLSKSSPEKRVYSLVS